MINSSCLVKGQHKITLLVKSQSKYIAGQHFDQGRRLEYRIYQSATPLVCQSHNWKDLKDLGDCGLDIFAIVIHGVLK